MPEEQTPTPRETRKLAAIMFTDIAGFSRQMGVNEAHTLRLLEVHNQLLQQATSAHHGTVIKTIGDAFLVDFTSVVDAVQCAQQIQHQLRTYNTEHAPTDQIHLRIGIHLGDVVQKDGDVFGDGVNIASRLQALAEPDTICLSQKVYEEVVKKLDLGTVVSLGRPQLKNIAERFQVYALLAEPPKGMRQKLHVQRLKVSRRLRPTHRMALAGLLLIMLTLGVVQYFRPLSTQDSALRTPAALPLPDKPSIAILPFVNMSNDPEQEYFSDGITEDITSSLSRISSLFVIARNSAFTYKGKAVKAQEVSKELGVRYLLEGSVRKADNQVRITAQLIDGTTGGHLWSERFDRPFKDIFALQDEIVQKIVTTLQLQLTLWEKGSLARKNTDNLEAYDYYLRGVEYFYRLTQETNAQARQMYEKAIELDPRYAQAYGSLGMTHFFDSFLQWNRNPQNMPRAFELVQKAIALEDSLPSAHRILGLFYLFQKRHMEALTEVKRAIALDPNFADAYWTLGDIMVLMGEPEKAIRSIEQAMHFNPRSPTFYFNSLGAAYLLARRYEEAVTALQQALSRNSNYLIAHLNLAGAYSELGREEEARAEAGEVMRLNPQFSLAAIGQTIPHKDPARLERYLAALRKAGLK
jgi:TolB-like protein/class 3 adenylate cyclase/Flp pilus assembly protein TadD